jgi:hypothetical protein
MIVGGLLTLVGSLWLLVRAFGVHWGWGLAVFFLPVLGPILFLFTHFRKAILPLVVCMVGYALLVAPIAFVALKGTEIATDAVIQTVPAGSRETISEDGPPADAPGVELRLTLTGAKREEYDKLTASSAFTVIQWANADVTDEDLKRLRGQTALRELDLNGTKITDDGLVVLQPMTSLVILRLARTKITEAGFQAQIAPLPNLMELDLRGTQVPASVGRAWKAAKPGRKLAI